MTTLAGTKIRRHRLDQTPRLTRQALAETLGVAEQTIAGWELGGKRAKTPQATRLAEMGIAGFADWYVMARCPRCDRPGDADAVVVCAADQCPMLARRVA